MEKHSLSKLEKPCLNPLRATIRLRHILIAGKGITLCAVNCYVLVWTIQETDSGEKKQLYNGTDILKKNLVKPNQTNG